MTCARKHRDFDRVQNLKVCGFKGILSVLAVSLLTSLSIQAQITASPPALLNTTGNNDLTASDFEPQIATDGVGHWVAVWFTRDPNGIGGDDCDIFVATSANNGMSWTAPALLNTNGTTDTRDDVRPQIGYSTGSWVVAWESENPIEDDGSVDDDIHVSISTNNGMSWSDPAYLNPNGATDNPTGLGDDKYVQLATDGLGNWMAVWEQREDIEISMDDRTGPDQDIVASSSSDNGVSWNALTMVNTTTLGDSIDDMRPQIATDGNGTWLSAWHQPGGFGNDAEIFMARSTNAGANWTNPAEISMSNQPGSDEGVFLTSDGVGNWVATWESLQDLDGAGGTDWDLFVARSTNSGTSWTFPELLNSSASSDTDFDDTDVQVVTDFTGAWIAVWNSRADLSGEIGNDADVFVSLSRNNGLNWTPALALNTNAATDSAVDAFPGLATDSSGNWVAVWQSFEDLNGTAGDDWDIFVSSFLIGEASGLGAVRGIIRDVEGNPLPCATVHVEGLSGRVASAITNLEGEYFLDNLPTETLRFWYNAPGFATDMVELQIAAEDEIERNVTLDRRTNDGSLFGIVTDETTGEPVAGANVGVFIAGILDSETVTCAEGSYQVPLPTSPTVVEVRVEIVSTRYETTETTITIDPTTFTVQDATMRGLNLPYGIGGRITDDKTGSGISGARIVATSGMDIAATITDAEGNYLIMNMNLGDYLIDISAGDYGSQSNTGLPVINTGISNFDFMLTFQGAGETPIPPPTCGALWPRDAAGADSRFPVADMLLIATVSAVLLLRRRRIARSH